jgi:O-antigen ligase
MKHIERVYPWILVAPAALPLVVWPSLIYPNLVPKTLLFYAVTFLSAAMFGILVTQGRAFYWGRLSRLEAQVPLALLVLAYGASAAGLDFYRSFWSLLVRGDGLLMLTCVVASFYLIVLSADRAWYDRFLKIVSIVATAIAVYGVGEWLLGGGRIGSLIGNAAFFAGYLGIAFFATLLSCVGAAGLSKGWRRFAYVGAAVQVLAIILTATRGTILALGVAGGLYLVYLSYAGRGTGRAWAVGTLATLAILSSLAFVFRSDLAKVPFEPIARVASISRADTDVASRLFIWEHMITEIKKSPWLGVGAEHIDVLFNRFYDPTQISEQWFDRSHNAFLDYAAQYGVIGLLCYLGIIISFVTLAAARWRRSGKGGAQEDGSRFAVLVALLAITYAVQNFFVFDTISSLWLFLALLALVVEVSSENVQKSVPFSVPAGGRSVAWLGAAVLVWLIIPVSVRPALAAYDLSQAYKYQLVDVPKEVGYLSRGIALGTYSDLEYGYEAYDMYANYQQGVVTGEARVDAYDITRSILTKNFAQYTYDARTALYLAHVLSLAPEGATPPDQGLFAQALERAVRLSPKRLQPWYLLANLSISGANSRPVGSRERVAGYAAAHDILTRYITLVPGLSEPYFVLAQLEYATGDVAASSVSAATGKRYYKPDLTTATRAATYYENVRDLPSAAWFLAEVLRLDPSNKAAADDLEKIRAYEQQAK